MNTKTAALLDSMRQKMEEMRKKSYLETKGIDLDKNIVIRDLFEDTLFRDTYRAIPNDFARSCLFTASNLKSERKMFSRAKLFHMTESIELLYTGQELRSIDDELIWLQLVDYCISTPLGNYVEFELRQLLKDIGWPINGRYYARVRESLSRMKATEIYIQNNATFGVSGGISLIENYIGINTTDTEPTRYRISIDPNLILLFAGGTFTNIPWSKYKNLSPMGRRLADYSLSHKYPNPIKIDVFLKLCGSEQVNSTDKVKNKTARKICNELVEEGVVEKAFVVDGKIVIER